MESCGSITKGICGVVVTYHPPPGFLSNLEALRSQVDEVIVVDNSEGDTSESVILPIEKCGASVIRNGKNLGIASALNLGIKYAISRGFEWVATFDQDSMITADYFQTILSAHAACPFRDRVPLIAPLLCYSQNESETNRKREPQSSFSLTRTAMTSGSLIRTNIFAKEGFYDETFFMDYVDYEFCLRLWKHGWKLIRANQAHLLHRLGLPQTHSFLGLKVTIKSHSAWRRYFIMRNRVIVFKRYAFSSPGWCLHDFFWIFLELTKILLFEKEKVRQLRATARGLWHGVRGKFADPA